MNKSIAIIQTSQVSSAELQSLCNEIIPGVKVYQFIDDSLLDEVVSNGSPTKGVMSRMLKYFQFAESLGVDLILNQCSSVGEVVDICRPFINTPIVKIDEAMARKAVSIGKNISVVATVESTVGPSIRLVASMAEEAGKDITIDRRLVNGAMMVLIQTGDRERHNEMIISEIEEAAEKNDVVVLAQGSMTAVEPLLSNIKKPVLTSPRLCIEYIKQLLEN